MIRKLATALFAAAAFYLLPALLGNPGALRFPQLWILVAFAVAISIFQLVGIVEAVYFRYPESFHWDAVTTVALVGMVVGLGLRVWAVLTLGRFFTWFITVYEDHQVIRSGPFRFIRHPAYCGALILFVATMVFLHAWVGALLSLVFQLFAYVRRIRYEEAMMIDRMGESYRAYTREVNALVPLLW
jgi:protein-S-isoprenylcysteine O-methyltransferase